MAYRPQNPVAWPYDVPSTWIGEGWIDLFDVGPFYWSGSALPQLYREANRFWRPAPNGGWCLAGVVVETPVELHALDESLREAGNGVTLWLSSSVFRKVHEIRNAGAVSTIVALRADNIVDLSPLKHFAHLRCLCLQQAACSDASILGELRELQALSLSDLQCLTSLGFVGRMSNLRHLEIQAGKCPDLRPIAKLSALDSLGLPAYTSDEELDAIANACRRLRRLSCSCGFQLGSLSPLARLTNLEALEIARTHVDDFTPLSALTGLKSLDLFNNIELRDLAPVLSMPRLTRLELAGCDKLTNFTPLQHMPQLTSISLPETVSERDLSLIARACPTMQRLHLDNREDVVDATFISELTELRRLRAWLPLKDIARLKSLTKLHDVKLKVPADCRDLSFLASWQSLRRLALALHGDLTDLAAISSLRDLQALNVMYGRFDAAVVSSLDNLVLLDINSCTEFVNVESLSRLSSLSVVSASNTPLAKLWRVQEDSNLVALEVTKARLKDLAPLADAQQLSCVNLEGNENSIDVAALPSLPNLYKLDLSKCAARCDLSPLADAAHLAELRIMHCAWLSDDDIYSLAGVAGLKSLSLDDSENLNDIAPLAKLKTLEDLSVCWCPGITDIKALSEVRGLRSLMLSGCDGIDDFSAIVRLNQLVSLLLDATQVRDVSFVRQLPDLRYIDVSQCWELEDISPLVGLRARGCIVQIAERSQELDELDAKAAAARARP